MVGEGGMGEGGKNPSSDSVQVTLRRLPAWKRGLLTVMGWMAALTEGYNPVWSSEIFATYSFRQAFRYTSRIFKVLGKMDKEFGEVATQFLAAMSATWNGCSYCSVGHLYAANLIYFKETGKLLPVSEASVPALRRLRDSDLRDTLNTLLDVPGLESLRHLVARHGELRFDGVVPENDRDRLMVACHASWDWLNECTIVFDQGHVPPLNAIGRQKALLAAYHDARAEEGVGAA